MIRNIVIFILSLVIWFVSFVFFKPWIVSFYLHYINRAEPGLKLFLKHTLVYSTPTAIICGVCIFVLSRNKQVEIIKFNFDKKSFLIGGLILFATLQLTKSRHFSSFFSGIIFGLTHDQYPFVGQIYISLIGYTFGYLTTKENNLAPAIIAHNLSDWILHLFF